ncbi:hypothetical protein [Streptomyces sp. LN325]|uniref:hypothetical protein n=1 Tax=Streptomyces sp. LN325 TaxID=3112976 RepID=UPI00371B5D75
MNADRESDHDMTHGDIAVLLATAADEVRIGPAPCQALVRGGGAAGPAAGRWPRPPPWWSPARRGRWLWPG